MKKKLIFVFISFFLLLIPFTAKASSDGYTITKYNVDIVVNENNVFNVTETLDVVYDQYYKHGIIREIPLTDKIHTIVDGKDIVVKQRPKYKNVSVNYDYSKSREDGYLNIKIGKASEYAEVGKTYTYVITYDYDPGDDQIDQYDQIYFNIIGTGWTANIEEVNFAIHMPKDFIIENDEGKLINFTVGYYGNAYNKGVTYEKVGNDIIGSVDKLESGIALYEREGLTVKLELPNGYFVGARKHTDLTLPLLLGSIGLFMLISVRGIIKFLKHGLRRKKISVVRYCAPEGLDPAACGFIYDGYSKADHIVSLIVYLATKGYLKIIDDKGSKFKLQYLKPLDDTEPNYIKTTYNGLFKKADEEGIVTKSQLTNKFYTSLNSAMSQLSRSRTIYDKKRDGVIAYGIFMFILSFFYLILPFAVFSYKIQTTLKPLYVLSIIVMIINMLICLIIAFASHKRTEEAEEEYADVVGFREFIAKVETDKIETLVEETPDLFYKVLPYAYVFNLTNKWIKKFESIKMSPPDWYEGNIYNTTTGMFDYNKLTSGLTSVTAAAKTTMSSRPYESYSGGGGGGGFSGGGGGGFSGGGGGGGGGHSW